jgi:hypothetical protein
MFCECKQKTSGSGTKVILRMVDCILLFWVYDTWGFKGIVIWCGLSLAIGLIIIAIIILVAYLIYDE